MAPLKHHHSLLEPLFLGYHGYYDQCYCQIITQYYHPCHKQPSKSTMDDEDLPVVRHMHANVMFSVSCVRLSRLPRCSFSFFFLFFTISKAEIIVTGACVCVCLRGPISGETGYVIVWFSHCHPRESAL